MEIPIGDMSLIVRHYINLEIRTGFSLLKGESIKNRSGALEYPIYTKDMKLRGLRSKVPLKQKKGRVKPKKVIIEEFITESYTKYMRIPVF